MDPNYNTPTNFKPPTTIGNQANRHLVTVLKPLNPVNLTNEKVESEVQKTLELFMRNLSIFYKDNKKINTYNKIISNINSSTNITDKKKYYEELFEELGEFKKTLENYKTTKNTPIDVESFCINVDRLIFIVKQVLEHYKKKIENLEQINDISNRINNNRNEISLEKATTAGAYNRHLKNNLKQRKKEMENAEIEVIKIMKDNINKALEEFLIENKLKMGQGQRQGQEQRQGQRQGQEQRQRQEQRQGQMKKFEHFKKKLEVIFNIIVEHKSYDEKIKYYEQVKQELRNFRSMIQGLKVDNEQTKNSLITTLDKQISRIEDPIIKTFKKYEKYRK